MFGPDGIVVTSLAVTYLTVTNQSKVNQGHCHWNPWDNTRMHQMNRFGIDVVFGSDAAMLKSPTATYLTLKSRYCFGIDVMFCWGNVALTSKVQGRNDLCNVQKWIKGQPRSLHFELFWDMCSFLVLGSNPNFYIFLINKLFLYVTIFGMFLSGRWHQYVA